MFSGRHLLSCQFSLHRAPTNNIPSLLTQCKHLNFRNRLCLKGGTSFACSANLSGIFDQFESPLRTCKHSGEMEIEIFTRPRVSDRKCANRCTFSQPLPYFPYLNCATLLIDNRSEPKNQYWNKTHPERWVSAPFSPVIRYRKWLLTEN